MTDHIDSNDMREIRKSFDEGRAKAMTTPKLTPEQIFDGYYHAMKLSYPDNQTAHAVAREVRDIFNEYAAQQQGEYECPKCHRSLKKGERCIASTCDRDYEPDCVAVPVSYKRRLSEVQAEHERVLAEAKFAPLGELAVLRECFILLEGLRIGVEWELAPSIKEEIARLANKVAALLAADKEAPSATVPKNS